MSVHADIVIRNGRVLTMDETQPRAEAVAIAGNRILALGSDPEIAALRGPHTREIDAGGGTVLPGFIESHAHLFTGAVEMEHLNLFGVQGLAALGAAVRAYAEAHPDLALVTAQGADYTILSATERLTRHHLDAVLPDRPLVLVAPDHHTMWANTAALAKAGLLQGRALGPGNEIVMGADGLAEGELREREAFGPVLELGGAGREMLGLATGGEPDPEPSPAEFEADMAALERGLRYAASLGITSLHNMDGNRYTLELLAALERKGRLIVRLRVPYHYRNFHRLADLERASEFARDFTGDTLCSGFVKVFYDGVLDSGTAVLIEPYADAPEVRGDPLFSPEDFAALATEIDRRGLQIAVHAIGDGAVRAVLDGYEAAQRINGRRDSRHRIEHIELIHPDDLPRFAELGVIASMQPVHPPGSAGLPLEPTLSKIGRARWPYAYAWKRLKDAGARLAFSTDWPVSPLAPLNCIEAAMLRTPFDESVPDQRLSLHETLHAYTAGGAFAEFAESAKGKLAPGLFADLVILSRDIEATPAEEIGAIAIRWTLCDGRVTYDPSAK